MGAYLGGTTAVGNYPTPTLTSFATGRGRGALAFSAKLPAVEVSSGEKDSELYERSSELCDDALESLPPLS